MSEDPAIDAELGALWRTEEKHFDAAAMRASIERDQLQRRRSDWLSIGIQLAILPIIVWMDYLGALEIRGVVGPILVLGLAFSVYSAMRKLREVELADGALAALEAAIASKRKLRRHGLTLAFGFPLSIAVGYTLPHFLDPSNDEFTAPDGLLSLLLVLAAISVAVCGAWGLRIARDAHRDLQALLARREALDL